MFYALAILILVAFVTPAWAAWKVDPDFRPLPGFGFQEASTVVQPDGEVLINPGLMRLNSDGTKDASYAPAADDRRQVWVSTTGQIIGLYPASDPDHFDLVRLDQNGNRTTTKATLSGSSPRLVVPGTAGEFYLVDYSTVRRIRADGALDPTFDIGTGVGQFGLIVSFFPQADGKVLLGGSFTSFAGFARAQIVRLNNDGTVDPSFDAGAAILPPGLVSYWPEAIACDSTGGVWRVERGEVRRMTSTGANPTVVATMTITGTSPPYVEALVPVAGGKVLVSGSFDRINGIPRKSLARLNPDGTVDEAFDAGVAGAFFPLSNAERGLHVLADGRIHSGVRLFADGRLDPSFVAPTPSPGSVACAAPMSDGRTVVGGRFTHINGVVRAGLAVIGPDGAVDSSFASTSGANDTINAVAVHTGGSILAGGTFSTVDGNRRNGLARFLANGASDTSFDAGLNDGAIIHAIAVQDSGAILIGGTFSSVAGGTPRSNLAGLLPNGTLDPSFTETTGVTGNDAVVRHIEWLPNGQWLVAGYFDAWNNTRRWSVMRLNANGSSDASFDPGSTTSGFRASSASTASDGTILLGGNVGGTSPNPTVLALDQNGAPKFTREVSSVSIIGWEIPALLAETDGASLLAVGHNGPAYYGVAETYTSAVRLLADGTIDKSFAPEFATGHVRIFARESSGTVLTGGDFVQIDGMAYAGLARLIPDSPAPRLANISTRGYVGQNDEILIAGFFVSGDEPQRVLIRGIAKNLEPFGVPNLASYPSIHVYRAGETTPFRENLEWYRGNGSQVGRIQLAADRVGAFPLPILFVPIGQTISYDAALLLDLPHGGYTVQMRAQTPGIGLVEIYDANGVGAVRKLINISTRGRVGTGDERMIAGFVVDRGSKRVLIRAVGPGIASLIAGTLANPTIDLVRSSDQATITSNDNWGDNLNAAAIAAVTPQVSGLTLANGSADSALLVDLPAGAYTVIAAGVGATSGIALVEVYEVP